MSEQTTPSEQPYDPAKDPDADPEMLDHRPRPSQAEGEGEDSPGTDSATDG